VGQSCLDGQKRECWQNRIIKKATGILASYIPDLDGDDMGMLFRAHGSRNTRPKLGCSSIPHFPYNLYQGSHRYLREVLVVAGGKRSSLVARYLEDSGDTSIGETSGKVEDEGVFYQHKIFSTE
jgi:hypothetical protein